MGETKIFMTIFSWKYLFHKSNAINGLRLTELIDKFEEFHKIKMGKFILLTSNRFLTSHFSRTMLKEKLAIRLIWFIKVSLWIFLLVMSFSSSHSSWFTVDHNFLDDESHAFETILIIVSTVNYKVLYLPSTKLYEICANFEKFSRWSGQSLPCRCDPAKLKIELKKRKLAPLINFFDLNLPVSL